MSKTVPGTGNSAHAPALFEERWGSWKVQDVRAEQEEEAREEETQSRARTKALASPRLQNSLTLTLSELAATEKLSPGRPPSDSGKKRP